MKHTVMTLKSLINRILTISIIATTLTSLTSCSDEPSGKGDCISRAIEITESEYQASKQSNVFAWNLLLECMDLDQGGGNVVVSPISANLCLSMLANGASSESRAQILETLGFSESDMDNVNSLNSKLAQQICGLDDNVTLSLANSFWYREDIKPKSAFLNDIKDNYDVESYLINPQTYSSDVNSWCYEKTKGLIPSIMDDRTPQAFAFLNAIYFKGFWNSYYRFEKKKTEKDDFLNSDQTKSVVNYMCNIKSYPYHRDQLWKAMRIPFSGGGFSFTVILPNEGVSVDECISSIVDFESATAEFNSIKLDLKMPKLNLKYSQDLSEVFNRMGICDIFDPYKADFSNMTDEHVTVDLAKQNVSFLVDEEGAEAAAVTKVSGDLMANIDIAEDTFYIDHPFIFLISEKSTGAILFLGRINKL